MILAIDIGGTKTLVAVCDINTNTIVSQYRFETPKLYKDFINELANNVAKITTTFTEVVVAVPARLDRTAGLAIAFGNLPWKNVPIQADIAKIVGVPVVIENDANLAALSEANRLQPLPHRVLYLTISTGIGSGIVKDGKLDPEFLDSEAGNMIFEHNGRLQPWEHFASGKAIVAQFGKRASDIDDPEAWQQIARWLAVGIVDLVSVLDPDVIVIGGGVGSHFAKFSGYLRKDVSDLTTALVNVPEIVQAVAPEEAVIYGCIIYAQQNTAH